MKKLLEFLFSGCWHVWEIKIKTTVYGSKDLDENIRSGKAVPIGNKYTLQCKKCGEMKTFKEY